MHRGAHARALCAQGRRSVAHGDAGPALGVLGTILMNSNSGTVHRFLNGGYCQNAGDEALVVVTVRWPDEDEGGGWDGAKTRTVWWQRGWLGDDEEGAVVAAARTT